MVKFKDYIIALWNFSKNGKDPLFTNREFYLSNADYILDAKGRIIVDFVGKYENRQKDIKLIAQRIGCPELGQLMINKSKRNRKHYIEYYDKDSIEMVGKLYRKDIELFGYQFGD